MAVCIDSHVLICNIVLSLGNCLNIAQEPNLHVAMVILHVLVTAVLVFVGQSTACGMHN